MYEVELVHVNLFYRIVSYRMKASNRLQDIFAYRACRSPFSLTVLWLGFGRPQWMDAQQYQRNLYITGK